MRLWLAKSEARAGLFGGLVYRLSMALDISGAELSAIRRHGLETSEVWASPAALAFDAEAEAAFDKAAVVTFGGWKAANKNLGWSARGLWLARGGDREGRVCVGDLLAGKVLEADEVAELLAAEAGVRAGFDALAKKLRVLEDYEIGGEDLAEPTVPDSGIPARDWVRMVR